MGGGPGEGGATADSSSSSTGRLLNSTLCSVGSATVAALSAAPFISIVDKAITSNASGRQSLFACMREGLETLVRRPVYFVRQASFIWICGVYGATYVVANLTAQASEHFEVGASVASSAKFATTSLTNMGMSVAKDRAFARMFSRDATTTSPTGAAAAPAPPRSFPLRSMGLFAGRDSMTILASFTLPPLIAPVLGQHCGLSETQARTAAQLSAPLLMQLFSVPLHLHGLDLYNRPSVPAEEPSRLAFVAREYGKTVVARWMRILPAFSLAGVLNYELLHWSRAALGVDAPPVPVAPDGTASASASAVPPVIEVVVPLVPPLPVPVEAVRKLPGLPIGVVTPLAMVKATRARSSPPRGDDAADDESGAAANNTNR